MDASNVTSTDALRDKARPGGARPGVERSTLLLGVVWAFLAASPLVLAGVWPEETWSLTDALAGVLVLAVTVLPTLWFAIGGGGDRAAAAHRVLLLVSGGLPALTLAAAFSGSREASVASALVYVGALWLSLGVFQARVARGRRRGAFVLVASWCLALPLALSVSADLGLRASPWLEAATPLRATLDLLAGGDLGLPWAIALGLLALLAASGVVTWRRAALAASLASLILAPGALAEPRVREVRPLLGRNVRPGEPYPLSVALEGLAGPADLAAVSFGHRLVRRAQEGRMTLEATPLGSGRRLDLQLREGAGEWSVLSAGAEHPRVVAPQTLIVGTLGRSAPVAARRLFRREAALVALDPRDVGLLARAGEAFDVVVVDPGLATGAVAGYLRAWTAAGGVLVLTDSRDLRRVATDADLAARGRRAAVELRPIGAGLLVGPGGAGVLPIPDARLRGRLEARVRRRARRALIQEAALALPEPGPSRALGQRAGLASLACALVFAFLAPLGRRLPRATSVAGAAALSVALSLVCVTLAGPSGQVYAASAVVLEAPAGARVARRLRVVTCSSVRPALARVVLEGQSAPRPLFNSAQVAARSTSTVVLSDGRATLEVPLARRPRAFLRQDAVTMQGVFSLTRGRGGRTVSIHNRTGDPLRDVFALSRGGMYRVPDLEPGASFELDLLDPPIPFGRWRLTALDRATRAWRRLVTATLSGRDLERSLLLIGKGTPRAQVLSGVAQERALPPLVIVVASEETL